MRASEAFQEHGEKVHVGDNRHGDGNRDDDDGGGFDQQDLQ